MPTYTCTCIPGLSCPQHHQQHSNRLAELNHHSDNGISNMVFEAFQVFFHISFKFNSQALHRTNNLGYLAFEGSSSYPFTSRHSGHGIWQFILEYLRQLLHLHTWKAAAVPHLLCQDDSHSAAFCYHLEAAASCFIRTICLSSTIQQWDRSLAFHSILVSRSDPSAADLALVTEDPIPAELHTTMDQLQPRPVTTSRALPLQAHLHVMGSNSTGTKAKSLQPSHASAPLE